MPITFTDIFDVRAEEEAGQIVSLQRRGRVEGLESADPQAYIAEILASENVPASGSAISVNGNTLYLRRRSPNVGSDHGLGQASVDLFYERSEGSVGETGETPTLEVRASLRQVERNVDREGDPFVVEYTWPEDAKARFPDGSPKKGLVEKQAGALSVFEPAVELVGEVVKATNNPGTQATAYIGKVNETAWQGYPPRHWLCTNVVARLIDQTTNPKLWNFQFGFELDDTGWDTQTTLVFVDTETGKTPDDVAEGNGLVTYNWYETKAFNEDF
jgi:hypothetical protein